MSLLKLLFCEKYFNRVIDRIRSKRKVKFASSKVQPKKTKTRNTNVGSFGATCLLQFSKVYYRGISRPSLVKCYGLSPRPPQYPHPPSKHPPPPPSPSMPYMIIWKPANRVLFIKLLSYIERTPLKL